MTALERALLRGASDLRRIDARFALVGGLAVSLRAEPRTTRDVDLVVAVGSDAGAERVVRDLLALDYRVTNQIEHERARRLASVRVEPPGEPTGGIVVDLLFASSGIEREVVDSADEIEVLPGARVRVATTPYLVALKILAGRRHDRVDIDALLPGIDAAGHEVLRKALELISRRGFDREKDLMRAYQRLVRRAPRGGG